MKRTLAILVLLAARAPAVGAAVPVVYADESIIVRAAVAEAGSTAIHVGDALTLIVEAVFDPDEVQVERLDEDWFRRAFADVAAFSLYRSGEPATTSAGRNARLTMQWQFQVVDCPKESPHCPGPKRYELPLASIAYRLLSAAEPAAANRSARFRPWPGGLTVVPSIRFDPEGDTEIDAVIAGGAWPAPKVPDARAAAGTAMLALGGILLGSGFIAGRRRRPAALLPAAHRNSRWERTALKLADDTLDDAAWSDLLRRCLTWYCLDELGRNPFEWLHTDPVRTRDAHPECRELFHDILAEGGIEAARRSTFRARFVRATGNRIPLE